MAYHVSKTDLELLNRRFNNWNTSIPINKHTIISFIKGFETLLNYDKNIPSLGEDHTISGLISNYLWNKYKIKHINLERSINHLSKIQEQHWVETFIQVFYDFQNEINWNHGYARIDRNSVYEPLIINKIKSEQELPSYKCLNGSIIQKGTIIQLNDLMNENYKETIYFDVHIDCPKWDLFIPSDRSFKFVNFLHDDTLFGNVIGIYSLMTSEVVQILEIQNKVSALTNHFLIEIDEALKKEEILIEANHTINHNQDWQENNLSEFHERAENYILGFITKKELWSGILGLDTYAPFHDRMEEKGIQYGIYGRSIKDIWELSRN